MKCWFVLAEKERKNILEEQNKKEEEKKLENI